MWSWHMSKDKVNLEHADFWGIPGSYGDSQPNSLRGGGATDLTRGLLFCLQWYIAAVLSIQYREYENLCSRVQMLLWCEKMRTIANLSFFPPFMWHTTCTNPSKKIIKKNIDRNIWDIVVAQVWSYNWGWVFFSELPNPMLTHIKWESAHIYSKIPMIDFQYYSIW